MSWWKTLRPVTQEHLPLLLRSVCFISSLYPLSKASHSLSLSTKYGVIVKMEMCNTHSWGESRKYEHCSQPQGDALTTASLLGKLC